jgi:hypothetical protein
MTTLEDVGASVSITDGRVSMSVEDETDLYLKTPEHEPLSVGERHATLEVVGEGLTASVSLDGDDLDAFADAVNDARAAHRDD